MVPHKAGKQMRVWAMALMSALAAAPAVGAEMHPGTADDTPVWTDKPVRIDRNKQSYERLAVEHVATPLRIRVSSRVTVFDSASFRVDGRLYVLTDAVGVDPKRFCRGAGGAIAVCGQQARLALRRLIANHTLSCEEDFRAGGAAFLRCTAAGKDVAESLVASGAAWAATPRYETAQRAAIRQKLGVWIDEECRALGGCPPHRRR